MVGTERIREALNLALEYRAADTPVGLITDAASKTERLVVTDIVRASQKIIGMNTLVIIGNSRSYVYAGNLITPRPYKTGAGY
jgi:precorrin-3B C17-methyltransferase